MKHLKLFESFTQDQPQSLVVFHNSYEPIPELSNRTMWFSLDLKSGLGFYDNAVLDTGAGHLYRAEVRAKILTDPKPLFDEAELDFWEWVADVVGNPSEEEVESLEGTQMIKAAGWQGVIYPDYDPWDSQADIDTLILFDPKQVMVSWQEIDAAAELKKHQLG